MIKLLKGSFTWTIGIISIIFTFVPESSFQKYKLERVHIKRASKIIANMMTDRKMESSLS